MPNPEELLNEDEFRRKSFIAERTLKRSGPGKVSFLWGNRAVIGQLDSKASRVKVLTYLDYTSVEEAERWFSSQQHPVLAEKETDETNRD